MAFLGVYVVLARVEHYGQYEMAMPSSDDTYYIQGTGSDNTRRDISHYNLKSSNQWIQDIWEFKYQGIDRANYAIDGIEAMEDYATDKKLQKLAAEAKFLRALLSFDLVKYWGDVPYKTTYTGEYGHVFEPRTSREIIYDQIVDDLTFAKNNLDWANGSSSSERANPGAARAILMRVLLQRDGYSLQMDGQ